jgi:hypothetical protein
MEPEGGEVAASGKVCINQARSNRYSVLQSIGARRCKLELA